MNDRPRGDADYTLQTISAASGLPVRTLRFYLAQGLLPSPVRQGQKTRYPASTLNRLTLLRRLRAANLPLAEIRDRLRGLSDADVDAALGPRGLAADIELVRGTIRPPTHTVPPLAPSAASIALARGWTDEEAPAVTATPALPALPGPAGPQRSQWERIVLEPGIELTVQRPLTRLAAKRVDRLVAYAHELLIRDLAEGG